MNIPDIAMKLLTLSCEQHENLPLNSHYVSTTEVMKHYSEQYASDVVSEKGFSLGFRYLEEKNYIRITKNSPFGMPSYIQVTAIGFDQANLCND